MLATGAGTALSPATPSARGVGPAPAAADGRRPPPGPGPTEAASGPGRERGSNRGLVRPIRPSSCPVAAFRGGGREKTEPLHSGRGRCGRGGRAAAALVSPRLAVPSAARLRRGRAESLPPPPLRWPPSCPRRCRAPCAASWRRPWPRRGSWWWELAVSAASSSRTWCSPASATSTWCGPGRGPGLMGAGGRRRGWAGGAGRGA